MQNIFLAPTTFGQFTNEPLKLLKKNKFIISSNQLGRKLQSEEIIEFAKDANAIIAGTEKYDHTVISGLPNLKVISRLGVGMDNIDLVAARERNIKVYKTKTTPAPAVAELALGLMIDVSRHVSLKNGTWLKEMGSLLKGKTLGIVGLGIIGKAVVQLCKGFAFTTLAFDQRKDSMFSKKYDVNYCDLETLLKSSDIVSIHLNLSDQTKNLIDQEKIELMKPDSILINISIMEILF